MSATAPAFRSFRWGHLALNYITTQTHKTMGLIDFVKDAGKKLFGKEEEKKETAAPKPAARQVSSTALVNQVRSMGLSVEGLNIDVNNDTVVVDGKVESQQDAEKIALALGNVQGISRVDNRLKVEKSALEAEAQQYTVKEGDSLSKIAQHYYGDPTKYNQIFEANRPMLKDADEIYPGQVLRIPPAEK